VAPRFAGNLCEQAPANKLVGQSSGRYDGALPIAEKGYYFARAQLEGGSTARSEKQYFRVG